MKVFVVGNIAMDQTLAVDRMPIEGESVLGARVSTDLGGKGTNQAVVLARCGIPTVLIAGVGEDLQGKAMRDLLAREPVVARLISKPRCPSDTSIVFKDSAGGNINITTVECAKSVTMNDVRPSLADAQCGDLLVLQGNLSLQTTSDIIIEARERLLKVALNPSPFDHMMVDLLDDLDMLFLNEHEAIQITGTTGLAAMEQLLKKRIRSVVLTLGEKGSVLGNEGGVEAVPAQTCNVVDSTGAGDTFQSVAIASAFLRDSRLDASDLSVAAAAAALTVSRSGTAAAFPSTEELISLLKTQLL